MNSIRGRGARLAATVLACSLVTTAAACTLTTNPPATSPGCVRPEFKDADELHPVLADYATQVSQAFIYDLAIIAATDHYSTFEEGSIEKDLETAVLALPADSRTEFEHSAQNLMNSPEDARVKEFGPVGRIQSYEWPGLDRALDQITVSQDAITESLKETVAQQTAAKAAYAAALDSYVASCLTEGPSISKANLNLDKVTAKDLTNWEWGKDEIWIGGIQVDHEGKVTKVNQQKVASFNSGNSRTYPVPGYELFTYDQTGTTAWPRTERAIVYLAEKDWGGFAEALQGAYVKIAGSMDIKEACNFLDPNWSECLEVMARVFWAAVKFMLYGWVTKFLPLGDEIFKPQTVEIQLPGAAASLYDGGSGGWTGQRQPTNTLTFKDFGGEYTVDLHWQVTT